MYYKNLYFNSFQLYLQQISVSFEFIRLYTHCFLMMLWINIQKNRDL